MSLTVTAQSVGFEFSNGHRLFQNLNFTLHDQIIALVGPNGVGKTTLAKLLTGELAPTEGSFQRKTSIGFLRQRENPPSISIENYLADSSTWSWFKDKLLEGLKTQNLCSKLSGGEWMRVRLARHLDDGFLILDEPTNDLDRSGRELIFELIRQRRGGTLLISHDRECLKLCDEVLELSNRGLAKFGAGWELYERHQVHGRDRLIEALNEAKRGRDATLAKRQEQLERQEKRNRQGQKVAERGGLPKILIGGRKRRAQVSTGKIDVSTMEKAHESVQHYYEALNDIKIDPVMYADLLGDQLPSQKLVMEAQNFNIRFQNWLYTQDLNFMLRGNIRLHLSGANGSGKSTLLKAFLGEKFESRGELKVGQLKTLYIDQSCAGLNDDKSLLENIQDTSPLEEYEIRNSLAKFLFTKDKVFQNVQELSGGERLRAALAKAFLSHQKPELLILDEPTNNLDLANIKFLENLIQQFPGALIVISHDDVFIQNCRLTTTFQMF